MRDEQPRGTLEQITQAEVGRLLALRQQAEEARITAAKRADELAAEEQRLRAALSAGAPIERGRYFLTLETEPTARSVAWKKIVEEHLGRPFAAKILADTPPGEKVTLRVLQEVPVDGAAAARGG